LCAFATNQEKGMPLEPKTQIYSALSGLNEAADLFLERLNRLHELTILSPEFAETRKLAVELARAEVNHVAVLTLTDIERDHCHETEQALIHLKAKQTQL
jgi:hypothetical protein